jgi:DNA modification methylase
MWRADRMTLHWSDPHLTIHGGDCREVLATLPAESVHCVVTSPPYWGLRDYGTATWVGGDEECDHAAAKRKTRYDYALDSSPIQQGSRTGTDAQVGAYLPACPTCSAIRQDGQLGLESTPDAYVEAMVGVFREVRRVLRADGTVWLNLGDSYASDIKGSGGPTPKQASNQGSFYEPRKMQHGLKPKDLVGIPWRVAFALQADGWYLRSDIIWSKPNPMPESVTDRPTKAHEYLFLLSKSARYFYDADAVREANTSDRAPSRKAKASGAGHLALRPNGTPYDGTGTDRNLRSVWTIATEPYPGAHFATFPRKLVEPCIKAGTSERGVCPECGAPWVRVVERETTGVDERRTARSEPVGIMPNRVRAGDPSVTTTGWRASCTHDAAPVPAVVLDPFAGSGTTLLVAQALGRRAIGIDLNPDYLRQCLERNRQMPLGMGAA